jgi:hypothetical protein
MLGLFWDLVAARFKMPYTNDELRVFNIGMLMGVAVTVGAYAFAELTG